MLDVGQMSMTSMSLLRAGIVAPSYLVSVQKLRLVQKRMVIERFRINLAGEVAESWDSSLASSLDFHPIEVSHLVHLRYLFGVGSLEYGDD